MSEMKVIEFYQECKPCEGTGLYSGMGEGKDCGVVCHNCKGTGRYKFKHSYNEFTGRKPKDVKHVYETNPGISVGEGNGHLFRDFGGMPYEEWQKTGQFPPKSENRMYTCPSWWYQSANYDLKPDWKECGYGAFSNCEHFCNKHKCWDRFDAEQEIEKKEELVE